MAEEVSGLGRHIIILDTYCLVPNLAHAAILLVRMRSPSVVCWFVDLPDAAI